MVKGWGVDKEGALAPVVHPDPLLILMQEDAQAYFGPGTQGGGGGPGVLVEEVGQAQRIKGWEGSRGRGVFGGGQEDLKDAGGGVRVVLITNTGPLFPIGQGTPFQII